MVTKDIDTVYIYIAILMLSSHKFLVLNDGYVKIEYKNILNVFRQ